MRWNILYRLQVYNGIIHVCTNLGNVIYSDLLQTLLLETIDELPILHRLVAIYFNKTHNLIYQV